ncbi:UDP-glucose 4-epimerase [Bacteroidia bacterium]|nr:UDP-glucose 4-epimerase [Bacteroidia bacterium]
MGMNKVLVTGANGYLGAQVCRHLSQQGYAVSGLCYPSIPDDKQWQQPFAELLVGDVRDTATLGSIAKNGYDTIVHLVSLDHHQSNGDPAFVASVNITPTWTLLDTFSKNGLRKFIYFSTIHVYGKNIEGAVTEEHAVNCNNAYALTHYLSENICRYYADNSEVECVVARLSNSYGQPVFANNNCWWLVVNDLCRSAWTDKKIVLQSNGSPLRDFIYGKDVCQAVQILIEKGLNKNVYHISSGSTYTILELAQKVQQVYRKRTGVEIPITSANASTPTVSKPYNMVNDKLKALGFAPAYDLEAGIANVFDYLKNIFSDQLTATGDQ